MPETPSPYYDASERVVALARDLEATCPRAAVILLTLASTMKIADFDRRGIDVMMDQSVMIAEMLQVSGELWREQMRAITESN